MRTRLIGAVSATALLFAGSAMAQSGTQTGQGSTMSQPGSSSSSETDRQGVAPGRGSTEKMLGKTVVGSNGEEIGEVKDIILDPATGQAKQLVIGSGGFLGIGEKDIAVDFTQAQMQPGADRISVSSLTRQQVQSMPAYKYDRDSVSLTRRNSDSGDRPAATGDRTESGTTTPRQ